ncbi:conserved hypothetical protein [Candidatus Nitrospira nitrificans]|uniref:Uncharacterized protein n=1 Tax=Candidatus Nitrospira nitrificans TaxID=1742973 RepID=A0A0S4LMY8_9BACT|nr:conserved hypothetical protein [Candidatus Nitrospira nitrificans]
MHKRQHKNLERGIDGNGGGGNLLQHGIEQRDDIGSRFVDIERGDSFNGRRVDDREIKLLVGGSQMNEQVEGAVDDVVDDRIRPVNLVDDDNGFVSERQGFPQHEGCLGHGAFFGIDQNQHPIHHAQRAFHFTAEIGMARRIDDVDFHPVVDDAGIFGPDRDPTLPFLIHRIHDALAHIVDLAMDVRLAEHGIDQGCFAVIDVGDDGYIPNITSTVLRGACSGHGDGASFMTKRRPGNEAQTWQYTRTVFFHTS